MEAIVSFSHIIGTRHVARSENLGGQAVRGRTPLPAPRLQHACEQVTITFAQPCSLKGFLVLFSVLF